MTRPNIKLPSTPPTYLLQKRFYRKHRVLKELNWLYDTIQVGNVTIIQSDLGSRMVKFSWQTVDIYSGVKCHPVRQHRLSEKCALKD